MGIPEARTELMRVADGLEAAGQTLVASEMRRIVNAHMYRQRVKSRKAPAVSPPVTPAIRDAIKAMDRSHQEMSVTDMANRFGINVGRVSEVLAGKYD